jgi:hypothetical protein
MSLETASEEGDAHVRRQYIEAGANALRNMEQLESIPENLFISSAL